MRTRAASMMVIVAVVLATLIEPAYGQGGAPVVRVNPFDAIAQLTSELAALNARVARLESGAVARADFVGTYLLYSLGIELVPQIPAVRGARIGPEAGTATVTLREDGTASLSGDVKRFNLVQGPWNVEDTSPPPVQVELTWSYANGVLSLGSGGEFDIFVAAGARILVTGTGNRVEGGGSWSQLLIGVKLP